MIDQITKAAVRGTFRPQYSAELIPGLLNLTYVQNVGAAFGLLPGQRPLFIATALMMLFVVAAYFRRAHPTQWPVVVALGLVAGGALGNLLDRAIVGRVTDFLEFAFVDFPVFNVADAAILVGVTVLMGWILLGPEELHEEADEVEWPEEPVTTSSGHAVQAEDDGRTADPVEDEALEDPSAAAHAERPGSSAV